MKSIMARALFAAIASVFFATAVGAQPADSALLTELLNRIEHLQSELASVRGENERLRHELERFKRNTEENFKRLQSGEFGNAAAAAEGDGAGTDTERAVPADADAQEATKAAPEATAETPPEEAVAESESAESALPPAMPSEASAETPSEEAVAESESTESAVPPAAAETAETMPLATIGAAVSDDALDEQEYFSYRNAMKPLEDADYAKARKRFARFLRKYPQGKYAADAKYWVAESYYIANNYNLAERYYKQVIANHKDHRMHDEALLRIASIRETRAEWDGARAVLQKLNSESQDEKIRALAKRRLERLTREGR